MIERATTEHLGVPRSDDAALAWAQYLWDTGRCARASEVASAVATDSAAPRAIKLLGRWRAFPALERICEELASRPARYWAGRELGYALGRNRWLTPLGPLLRSQPFERVCLAIRGAVEAIMGHAEPGDATRMIEVLVPAARAITSERDEQTRRKAARFRRGCCADLAAALVKCNARDVAEMLVDEIRAELDGLDIVDRACASSDLATVLMALGESERAEELLVRAERDLDEYFDEDVDEYGVIWFDEVADARAMTLHLSNWRHGMPWRPIRPVSRTFTGPMSVFRFPVAREAQEAWRNAIDFHVAATELRANPAHIAAAMDVVDAARAEQPNYVPWLIAYLAEKLDELDDACAARLISWLAALDPVGEDRAGHGDAVAAGARALARSRRGDAALAQAQRVENPWHRMRAGVDAACAMATRNENVDKARDALLALLPMSVPHAEGWSDLGKLVLADLDAPREHVPCIVTLAGAESDTFTIPEHLMALVLTFGNGLDGDVRVTANTADAVLVARGLVMGAGSCRRIEPPTDSPLYRAGDECYRQHPAARVFLATTPAS